MPLDFALEENSVPVARQRKCHANRHRRRRKAPAWGRGMRRLEGRDATPRCTPPRDRHSTAACSERTPDSAPGHCTRLSRLVYGVSARQVDLLLEVVLLRTATASAAERRQHCLYERSVRRPIGGRVGSDSPVVALKAPVRPQHAPVATCGIRLPGAAARCGGRACIFADGGCSNALERMDTVGQ